LRRTAEPGAFPAEEIKAATNRFLKSLGRDIFQYSNSEGYVGLREIIQRDPEEI
jgi:DNA-binding transcriptional MocR family regulator